jgi:hypothetical protein
VVVRRADRAVVDGLERDLVPRVRAVGQLEVRVDLVALPVADLDEVEQRPVRLGERRPQVRVLERALVGREVGQVLDRRRAAEAEREAVEVVEGLGRVAVAVRVPAHLAAEPVAAFLRADADDAGERVAVLGVESAREHVRARHGEARDAGVAAERGVRRLDAVELELHLAAAAAAEVQFAALGDDAGLRRDRLAQVVDGNLAELLGRNARLGRGGFRVDALLGAHLDLVDLLHDLLRADREVDRRGRSGVHLDRLDNRVVAGRHQLHLVAAHRDAGNGELAVLVRHRALARAEDDDVGIRHRLALLRYLPGDLADSGGGGCRGPRRGSGRRSLLGVRGERKRQHESRDE